mgnify:CR=1 FL=1
MGAVLSGRDCLGVMPTGAGKSICYQIPGVVLPGLTLVVSPLVSLMGDQVRALLDAGVRGSYLNSTLTPGQQGTVMRRALTGAYDIMYVAPERLADSRFIEFASSGKHSPNRYSMKLIAFRSGVRIFALLPGNSEFIDACRSVPLLRRLRQQQQKRFAKTLFRCWVCAIPLRWLPGLIAPTSILPLSSCPQNASWHVSLHTL